VFRFQKTKCYCPPKEPRSPFGKQQFKIFHFTQPRGIAIDSQFSRSVINKKKFFREKPNEVEKNISSAGKVEKGENTSFILS
jgi:hypothetical protein